tara:strand:+ start:20 stop:4243 length:4224 start_codon:yes stop_codon:yes gene_type:complete
MKDLQKKMKMTEFDRKERARLRGLKKEIQWYNTKILGLAESDEQELNELTIQARRKMAMSAKRTAKKRARRRKMKEKRKKSGAEIKKKAQKAAIKRVRDKMIKGMNWQDLSFSQREKVGERLKKKKGAIQKLAKRLLPATVKAEQERLKKVRARMTTNDPAKAVTNFESIDKDFEMKFLNEQEQEKTQEQEQERFFIVKNKNTNKIQVVSKFDPKKHNQVDAGAASSIKGSAKRASEEEDFDWKSSRSAMAKLGITKEKDEGRVKGFKDRDAEKSGKVEAPLSPTAKRTQANVEKAEELRSKVDAGTAQDEWDQYQQGKEDVSAQMNQVEMQNYATDMGQKLGIPMKAPTAKQAKKPRSRKDGQFDDWHDAVDVEAAVVAVGNGCIFIEDGDEMRKCLSGSGISDGDIKKLAESPTLIPAARRIWDRIQMQLPEGMQWQHTGKGLGEVNLSQTYDTAGAKNKTPKTDLRACDPKTGKCMNLSMKMGPGQLMSGQAGESIGTFRTVLDRMRGCQGRTIDSSGNETGVACNRKLGEGDKKLIKDMKNVIKNIEEAFIKTKLSPGMGPIGWWLGKGIGGQKPSWWDRTGPGRPGTDISWEEAKGKDPNDHPEWFMEDKAELEKNMAMIKNADTVMDTIQNDLVKIYSSGKFGQEIKEHVMYEAMTGCGKFCEGCCGTDICKECKSIHAATHVLVGNKDGTGGMIKEIEPPGSKMLRDMSASTTVDIRFKTTSGVKSAQGWIKEWEEVIFEKIKFLTKKEQQGIDSGDEQYSGLAKIRKEGLSDEEHERLLQLIAYTGQELPKGKKHWDKLTDAQKKKILKKAEVKLGVYNINSVSGMASSFEGGGRAVTFEEVKPKFRTFLEQSGDKEKGEYGLKEALRWVGNDPGRLVEFLGLEPVITAPHDSYGDVFEQEETSGASNTITIDGKTKTIPIAKDDEYRDYQAEREEGQEDLTPEQFRKDDVNEEFKLVVEKAPAGWEGTVKAMKKDKNIDNPWALSHWMKKKGHKSRKPITDSYEFKDSSTHGLGSFAKKEIKENEMVSLYYLNLLNENENAPQYQRTDFCRFTNHSQHIPNIVLIEKEDGNFYTYAMRDIQEGEELLINYFNVFESILPAVKEEGEVIPEVLRWTPGYEDLEIPPDSFGDLRDELSYFNEINESIDEKIEITGHNKKGHVVGGFSVHGKEDIERHKKLLRKHFENLHRIKVQHPDGKVLVTDDTSASETELEERTFTRGEIVRGRRGHHADQEYIVHSGNSDADKHNMTVKIGNKKVRVKPSNFNSTGRFKRFPGPKLQTEDLAKDNRKAYLKKYGAKPEQRERRSSRTNARNKAIRAGRASVGDGKDLDHKNGNPLDNSAKNLRMVSRKFNRGRDNNKWRKANEEHGAGEAGTKELLKKYLKDTPHMTINGKTSEEL